MNRYGEYSSSIIRWNYSYPSHWTCEKAKRFFSNPKELNKANEETNILSLTLKGVIRNNGAKPIGLSPSDYSTYQIFDANELVFKLIDLNNISTSRVGIVTEKGIMSSAYIRFKPRNNEINLRYFYFQYFDWYKRQIFNGLGEGVRQTLSGNALKNLEILVPPRPEQDQIVRYLDWQVSKINKLIAAKKKQIESIHEIALSDLYRVMTNGLSHECKVIDVDKRWIKSIPEHWEIVAIRRNFSSVLGKMLVSSSKNIADTLECYFCAKDVHFNTADKSDLKKMWFSPQEKESYLVADGDLLIVEGGAGAGGAAIAKVSDDEHIYVQNSIHLVRPKTRNASNVFLCYWMYCLQNRGYIDYVCNVATIPHFTKEKLLMTEMPFPPYAEQLAIVEYLDEKFAALESAEKILNKEINDLYELRTRIIYDVVTGQIDVRYIKVPDFEKVEEVEDNEDIIDESVESSEVADE